nr:PREDICTED: uncharacterized protein LOC105664199 [Megachile rotundata]
MEYDIIKSFIPHFDGKPSRVNDFIAQCRRADALVKTEDKTLLLEIIRNRMEHRVYRSVVGDNILKTVEELISLIKSAFAQSFDVNNIHNELKAVYRREHETTEEFGFRVSDILDRGEQAAKEELSSEELGGVRKLLMKSAVTGFLRGLRNNIIASSISKDGVKELKVAIRLASQVEEQLDFPKSSGNLNVFGDNSKVLVTTETRKCKCFNCGRTGHISADCWSRGGRRFVNPNRDTTFRCRKCGKSGHREQSCYRKNTYHTLIENPPSARSSTLENRENSLNSKGAAATGAIAREPLISRAGSTASAAKPI